ncbi:MAG: ribonuclease HII [Bryobacteraceae bacterium]
MPTRTAVRLRCQGILEREIRNRGYRAVAGVDEAGRGSLFGPVFAAAVVLSPERPIRGLRDSKILEAERREALAERIRERAEAWAVAAADAVEIDRINIYQASRLAMRRAIEALQPPCDYVLLDAMRVDLPLPQESLIKGDARVQGIAAASILAKVARDACIRAWDAVYPQYGLAHHKGYSTPAHLRALRDYGPTPIHRFSYEPVRACYRYALPPGAPPPVQAALWSEAETR